MTIFIKCWPLQSKENVWAQKSSKHQQVLSKWLFKWWYFLELSKTMFVFGKKLFTASAERQLERRLEPVWSSSADCTPELPVQMTLFPQQLAPFYSAASGTSFDSKASTFAAIFHLLPTLSQRAHSRLQRFRYRPSRRHDVWRRLF